MREHRDFIITPVSTILEDAVSATAGVGYGIETYPISEYIMQSIFLKMTGFQEQKMKCISWEMATNDYEIRRRLLNNDDKLGECSTYKSKNTIYKNLIGVIKKNSINFCISKDDKLNILNNTVDLTKNIFMDSILSKWNQKSFDYICANHNIIKINNFMIESGEHLFDKDLIKKYEILYKQRNRLAHNTLSYQQNLPTLKTLLDEDYESRNYFVWFSILILIDNIFIRLYNIYREELESDIY